MDYTGFIQAARGLVPADSVIKNVTMLVTPANERMQGDLAIAGNRIVAAGTETDDGKTVIGGSALYAVPGFIDSHVHVKSSNAAPFVFEQAFPPLPVIPFLKLTGKRLADVEKFNFIGL